MRKILFILCLLVVCFLGSCDREEAHEHSFGEWVITKEATCTQTGLKESSCSLCNDFAVMGVINGWTKYDFMGSYKIGQYDVMYNNKPGYNKDYYGDAIYNEISEIISKENAEKTHKSQRIAFLKKLKNDGYAKSYVKIDDLKLINEILGKEIFTYDSNDNIVKCDVLSLSKVIDTIIKQVRDYDRSH